MSADVIVDAGPALNFFSIRKERILLGVVGPIATPETVAHEVKNKTRSDRRFARARDVWTKLESTTWLEVLSDDETPELAAAVERISTMPMRDRMRRAKDLGEIMVVAHAAVRAEAGSDITILIDDGPGARLATLEMRRLRRLSEQDPACGSVRLLNTPAILTVAAGGKHIPDRNTMRSVYQQLRGLDDGLVHINQTGLLSKDLWASRM